jgi:hypothetical protein
MAIIATTTVDSESGSAQKRLLPELLYSLALPLAVAGVVSGLCALASAESSPRASAS